MGNNEGCTPGFIPAALQAAVGARRCRVPGVAPRRPGVAPRRPGVAPRASFPRRFRPPESGRSIGVVPGVHPGLHSRGPSGRSVGKWRAVSWVSRGCTSESRGCTSGFIPAAFQAGRERAIDWRSPGISPRASFPRPFRPAESGRSIGVVPGLHPGLSFPRPFRPLRELSSRSPFALPESIRKAISVRGPRSELSDRLRSSDFSQIF